MLNVFGKKSTASRGVQPWSETFAFGANIKDFYESRGNAALTGTNEIATLLDGPEKVVMYDDLTVGDGTTATVLRASQRCKGVTVIVRGNLTVKNNATISMTARGARVDRNDDPRFPFIDFLVPNKVGLYSEVMSRKAALELIAKLGVAPWDRGFWDSDGGALLGLDCTIVEAGGIALMQASGCPAGALGRVSASGGNPGNPGNAGVNGSPGSGGSGGSYAAGAPSVASHRAGKANPYSGGPGSGGIYSNDTYSYVGCAPSEYSGPGGQAGAPGPTNNAYHPFPGEGTVNSVMWGGGGAGNPGGKGVEGSVITPARNGESGTGGKLVIICYGNITIEAGGKIESNGSAGGPGGTWGGGGGSGGGHISLIYAGAYTNSGTVQCAGGAGGTGNYPGGAGGVGSVVTKTFTQMGWV